MHRLMASRVLAIPCMVQDIEFVESVRKPSVPRTRDSAQRRVMGDEIDAAPLLPLRKRLQATSRNSPVAGRTRIWFLIEAMDGGIKSFSPSL